MSDQITAGGIQYHLETWKRLTSDPVILGIVQGCRIEFTETPYQQVEPREISFSKEEKDWVDIELRKLYSKGVIVESVDEPRQFVSTIFLRPKKDNTHRVILNLKQLNEFVVYHHFKMDTIQACISLMEKDCYMASIDLRDAYYSVPIAVEHRKFLKFR